MTPPLLKVLKALVRSSCSPPTEVNADMLFLESIRAAACLMAAKRHASRHESSSGSLDKWSGVDYLAIAFIEALSRIAPTQGS